MSLCSTGVKVAKDLMHKLTPELEAIIDSVLKVTGSIMGNSEWPVIEALLQQLPGGAVVESIVKTGVDALTKVDAILKEDDWTKKIQLFIEDVKQYNPLGQHGLLIKLASILTAAIHASEIVSAGLKEEVHPESTYDSLVQIKAVTNSAEVKLAA